MLVCVATHRTYTKSTKERDAGVCVSVYRLVCVSVGLNGLETPTEVEYLQFCGTFANCTHPKDSWNTGVYTERKGVGWRVVYAALVFLFKLLFNPLYASFYPVCSLRCDAIRFSIQRMDQSVVQPGMSPSALSVPWDAMRFFRIPNAWNLMSCWKFQSTWRTCTVILIHWSHVKFTVLNDSFMKVK